MNLTESPGDGDTEIGEADCYPATDCMTTTSLEVDRPTTTTTTARTTVPESRLPVTGGDLIGVTVIALLLFAAGAALVLRSKRMEDPDAHHD